MGYTNLWRYRRLVRQSPEFIILRYLHSHSVYWFTVDELAAIWNVDPHAIALDLSALILDGLVKSRQGDYKISEQGIYWYRSACQTLGL